MYEISVPHQLFYTTVQVCKYRPYTICCSKYLLLTCLTCLYYTLYYLAAVQTRENGPYATRISVTCIYGSVTGSLHPHPVTD